LEKYLFFFVGHASSMKILCVNCVISEFGGVEFAAMNLALGLIDRGHEVHFLAAEGQKAQMRPVGTAVENAPNATDGIHRHYRRFPRVYPLGEKHGPLFKLIWHFQNLAHPANERQFSDVLREVMPDVIILHNITAVGMNIWRPIRKSGIPCIQVIHDLSLLCFNMSRFKGGKQCSRFCVACRLQKEFRFSLIRGASNFAFVAPSHATLREIEKYADLSSWRRRVIPNPNTFLVKPRDVSSSDRPRLLYVGRLDSSKGIEMMLRAAESAHRRADFVLDILGAGPLEQQLRGMYADSQWVKFYGSVDQETVADFMSHATALLVPSLWAETVPGVAVHALWAELPVIGSDIGGIPEHVMDGQTGRLLPPGDEAAWSAEIARVVKDQKQIAVWSAACRDAAQRLDPKLALASYERLMLEMIAERPTDSNVA
jgi:glycosyltransferase involved in cell wall biosynthesis